MLRIAIGLIILPFILWSCSEKPQEPVEEKRPKFFKEYFYKNWRLSSVIQLKESSEKSTIEKDMEKVQLTKKGFYLSIFPDNRAIIIQDNQYSHYTFKLNGELMLLKGNNTLDTIQFLEAPKKEGHSFLQLYYSKIGKMEFREFGKMLDNYIDDPYHPSNNTWRIPPKQKENDQELKKRLMDYIRHVALIMNAAYKRQDDIVHFLSSMGPIKIFNNGIGIHTMDLIPQYWKDCFYAEQYKEAYDMYAFYNSTHQYKGAHTGSWVNTDYQILLSLLDYMSNYPEITKE